MRYVVPAGKSEPVDDSGKVIHVPHTKLTSETPVETPTAASEGHTPLPPLDEQLGV